MKSYEDNLMDMPIKVDKNSYQFDKWLLSTLIGKVISVKDFEKEMRKIKRILKEVNYMTFVFNYNQKQLERACGEFTEIQKIVDNEICKGWDMKHYYNELNITKYSDYYRVGDCCQGIIQVQI